MASYYVLECMPPLRAEHFRLDVGYPANVKRWSAGTQFSPDARRDVLQPPVEPIPVETLPDDEFQPRVYAELYWNPIPLMTRRLVTALRAAGVDNLQTYETVLAARGGTPTPPDRYLAVNVVGKVAAADMDRSVTNPAVSDTLISADFHSLAVDAGTATDLLLFRLAENVSAVLVHERVRAHVEASGIDTLTWYAPEEWAG